MIYFNVCYGMYAMSNISKSGKRYYSLSIRNYNKTYSNQFISKNQFTELMFAINPIIVYKVGCVIKNIDSNEVISIIDGGVKNESSN